MWIFRVSGLGEGLVTSLTEQTETTETILTIFHLSGILQSFEVDLVV